MGEGKSFGVADALGDLEPVLTRRSFVVSGAGLIAAGAFGSRLRSGRFKARRVPRRLLAPTQPHASQLEALRVLGRSTMRLPGSLPHPGLAAGTDTMPEIEHVIVLMLENHSYDNVLGMLGRGPGLTPRGDGLTLGRDGYPTASNPYANGSRQRAFRMPTTCQLHGKPSQEWKQSHVQYANGTNQGFVISNSGPVAMGYWTEQDLPFTYALAAQFPIGDRWFSSALAQTDPNRRFLIAATALGMTDDIGKADANETLLLLPPGGTIFTHLTGAGISWADYNAGGLTGTTMNLYPAADLILAANAKPIAQFFSDAAAGTLPSFSLLDPDYGKQSQEDPQNVVVGESFLASVVHAIGSSPAWLKTILIVTYDEHGGYYDHVPPPVALAPDGVGPVVESGESTYDGYARYGFRVPSIVVSPYAKRDHVSHVVYDHTSILAFLERKWNLPAMTHRDANANDLTDFLDLNAMAAQQPTFPQLPKLPASGENPQTLACSTTGPGKIPPPSPPPIPLRVEMRDLGVSRRRHGLELELWTTRSTLHNLVVELHRGARRVGQTRVSKLSQPPLQVVLRSQGRAPAAGHYTVVVRQGARVLLRHGIRVR
jgi:phospholipase C